MQDHMGLNCYKKAPLSVCSRCIKVVCTTFANPLSQFKHVWRCCNTAIAEASTCVICISIMYIQLLKTLKGGLQLLIYKGNSTFSGSNNY